MIVEIADLTIKNNRQQEFEQVVQSALKSFSQKRKVIEVISFIVVSNRQIAMFFN